MASNFPSPINSGPARFIGGIFGFAFFGIGLTVLGSLWLGSSDFGSPPLVFRMFGSFIAICFVAVGGATAYGTIFGKRNSVESLIERTQSLRSQLEPIMPGTYTCPHCAAPLQSKADVSPSGDTKCTFCNSWFNVHQPKA